MKKALMMRSPIKIITEGRAKVLVNGEEIKVEDITAVRYDFGSAWLNVNEATGERFYNEEALSVVAHNRKEISRSLHIAQVDVISTDMKAVVEHIREKCGNIAVFVYVSMGNTMQEQLLATKQAFEEGLVDRIIIREPREAELDAVGIKALLKMTCETLGVKKDDNIGLCDSPVGCSIGRSCLSAALCRHLSAKYGDDIDMVVPSQNHEGMSEDTARACNCIGYTLVDNMMPCPVKVGKTGASAPKAKTEKTSDNQSSKKKSASGKKIIGKW